ncbi:tyrosine-type recombinase/integrase [uncultured Mameliella sp.]|uniref:tyrosine-type recombinase/integrase n=1 Tax=uncultured Mameliella sp. TaxID=1447087 RepID=UPI00345D385A
MTADPQNLIDQQIETGFRNAVKASGLSGVPPHFLRHTAAVHLAEAGVRGRAQPASGHTGVPVTETVHPRFSLGHLRKAASALQFSSGSGSMNLGPLSF